MPLGFAVVPLGVHDVERLFGVECLGLVMIGLAVDQVVPPHVTTVLPVDLLSGAAHNKDRTDCGALPQGIVDLRLER